MSGDTDGTDKTFCLVLFKAFPCPLTQGEYILAHTGGMKQKNIKMIMKKN